jgi:hypothetical protein
MDEELHPVRIVETPQEMTASRRKMSQALGRTIRPFPKEIQLYLDAGLEPPTE